MKSKLHFLPLEDQNKISDICQQYTYHKAVDVLSWPRSEGGLSLKTSKTALCRFVTHWHSGPEQAEALAQLAKAVLVRSQSAGQAVLASVISLVEQDIFHRLIHGSDTEKLLPEFRVLHKLHRNLFAMEKWKNRHDQELHPDLEEYNCALASNDTEGECEVPEPGSPASLLRLNPHKVTDAFVRTDPLFPDVQPPFDPAAEEALYSHPSPEDNEDGITILYGPQATRDPETAADPIPDFTEEPATCSEVSPEIHDLPPTSAPADLTEPSTPASPTIDPPIHSHHSHSASDSAETPRDSAYSANSAHPKICTASPHISLDETQSTHQSTNPPPHSSRDQHPPTPVRTLVISK